MLRQSSTISYHDDNKGVNSRTVLSTGGGYLEYRGGVFSTVGDIMINVGGCLEYRRGVQYCGGTYRGGYLEYLGEYHKKKTLYPPQSG